MGRNRSWSVEAWVVDSSYAVSRGIYFEVYGVGGMTKRENK